MNILKPYLVISILAIYTLTMYC